MGKKMVTRSGASLISQKHQTIREVFLASAEGEGVLVRIDGNEEERSGPSPILWNVSPLS